jgi:NAD(P)-dependent dehydrogenase (short-subunit alcohol dehydrogenase family)
VSAIVLGVGPQLGTALVEAYASTGRAVAAVSRSGSQVPGATAFAADLGAPEQVARVIREASDAIGAPDIVHYNASVLVPGAPSEVPLEAVETAWRVGCLGAWAAFQASLPLMDEDSAFFVTGGGLALNPWPGASSLAGAKAALRNFVLAAAAEGTHVRVAMVTVAGVIGKDIGAGEIARNFLGLLEEQHPAVETVLPRS